MTKRSTIHNFQPGDIFHDRYTLERVIGVGGFADVWKATDNVTKTVVALKIYTNLDDDGIKDLSEEYTQVQALNHTNILKANHFDRWGNLPYLVMKFCSGGSLDKRLTQLSNEEIHTMIEEISAGLKYLHDNGIVHQDIKPANILVDEFNGRRTYVLSDFGISTKTKTRLSHSVQLTNQGVSMTEAYAPPEKFSPKREERRANPKGDIFSFGISIYEIVTGGMPFDDLSTGRQLMYENVEVDFSEIEDEDVRNVVEACMDRNREERPTAGEIPGILCPAAGGLGAFPGAFPGGNIDMSSRAGNESRKKQGETASASAGNGGGGDDNKNKTVRTSVDSDGTGRGSGLNFKLIGVAAVVAAIIGIAAFFFFRQSAVAEAPAFVWQVDTLLINDIPIEMVKIPGGEFIMGAVMNDTDADSAEVSTMKRRVKDFYMARFEVTQQLWESVMGSNPSSVKGDKMPVNNVSAQDVDKFIQRLNTKLGVNFRLPTESEWEYVAKCRLTPEGKVVDEGYLYPGDPKSPDEMAWYAGNSGQRLHDVGLKSPNSFGLYDISGNVAEWCSDTYIDYTTGNPVINDSEQSLRGGYYSAPLKEMRSSNRGSCASDEGHPEIGFRLVY